MPVRSITLLLAIFLLLGQAHLLFPDYQTTGKIYNPFLFSSQQLTIQTYAYFLFQHASIIILAYIIWIESIENKKVTATFLFIQIADLIDYLLTYNSEWFTLYGIPVSVNTVGMLIFGYVVLTHDRDSL